MNIRNSGHQRIKVFTGSGGRILKKSPWCGQQSLIGEGGSGILEEMLLRVLLDLGALGIEMIGNLDVVVYNLVGIEDKDEFHPQNLLTCCAFTISLHPFS